MVCFGKGKRTKKKGRRSKFKISRSKGEDKVLVKLEKQEKERFTRDREKTSSTCKSRFESRGAGNSDSVLSIFTTRVIPPFSTSVSLPVPLYSDVLTGPSSGPGPRTEYPVGSRLFLILWFSGLRSPTDSELLTYNPRIGTSTTREDDG